MSKLMNFGRMLMRMGTILTLAGLAIIFPYIAIPGIIGLILYKMSKRNKI